MQKGRIHPEDQIPKCGGSIYMDNDVYGWLEQYFQCGHFYDLAEIIEVRYKANNTYFVR